MTWCHCAVTVTVQSGNTAEGNEKKMALDLRRDRKTPIEGVEIIYEMTCFGKTVRYTSSGN